MIGRTERVYDETGNLVEVIQHIEPHYHIGSTHSCVDCHECWFCYREALKWLSEWVHPWTEKAIADYEMSQVDWD